MLRLDFTIARIFFWLVLYDSLAAIDEIVGDEASDCTDQQAQGNRDRQRDCNTMARRRLRFYRPVRFTSGRNQRCDGGFRDAQRT